MMQQRKLLGEFFFFFKSPNIPKGLSFASTWALYSRSLHFLEECTRKAETLGIWGHNECILCHFKLTQDHWQEIKTESKNLCWKGERAPEGHFLLHYLLLWVMSVYFMAAVILNAFFLSCEMHSFNFPGGELEGLIDG